MKISLNEIKQYVKIPATVTDDDLIELIGARLVEIEEVIDLAPKYRNIYIAKVVASEKIEGTHLTLCQIDAGEVTSDFSKDGEDTVQVVCGAPNVHTGMLAVWLAPGAIVPETYGNENFKLGTRKLRGYESNGMLAAVDELDLGTDHEGIVEIDPKTARPGDSFAEVFGLNDLILDVENKSLTHRPDCFGLIGFAREVAGILGVEFEEPKLGEEAVEVSGQSKLDVKIEDHELCPRYVGAVINIKKVKQDKYFTKNAVFLAKAGMRSIDTIVDLTNILMLRTGQPLHAFDYDKLVKVGGEKDARIIVRAAKDGEGLQLLDGKTIKCIPEDILITSNNVPVALAGAMGGKNTEIDASTTKIVLESATFSLYHLRKTQMAHGIFSEAITRFTKGQPAAMCLNVLRQAAYDLGQPVEALVDEYPEKQKINIVKITAENINSLLGTDYSEELMIQTMLNVGFRIEHQNNELVITAPVWRTDIHIKEDIIEEIGRLLGYDNIKITLPERFFEEAKIDEMLEIKSEIRDILSNKLDAHEVLTYSFVSKKLLEKVGEDVADSYEIINSISPELQCFRQQIVPSLLDKIRENLKAGHKDFTIYEMNQVTSKAAGMCDEKTPMMSTDLGMVSLGDFYHLKAMVLELMKRELRLELSYARLEKGPGHADKYPYLEPKRSVEIFCNDQPIGAFGEVKRSVLAQMKLDKVISALEVELGKIVDAPKIQERNFMISKFPSVERDLTFTVAADAVFGRVENVLNEVLKKESLIYTVTPVSIYQADPNDLTKNISFRIKFSNPEKTLDSEEISDIIERIKVSAANIGATTV